MTSTATQAATVKSYCAYSLKGPALTTCSLVEHGQLDIQSKCTVESPTDDDQAPALCQRLRFPSPGAREVGSLSFLLGSTPPERPSRRDRSRFLPSFREGSEAEQQRATLQ